MQLSYIENILKLQCGIEIVLFSCYYPPIAFSAATTNV